VGQRLCEADTALGPSFSSKRANTSITWRSRRSTRGNALVGGSIRAREGKTRRCQLALLVSVLADLILFLFFFFLIYIYFNFLKFLVTISFSS
jgi:hypothetical protein